MLDRKRFDDGVIQVPHLMIARPLEEGREALTCVTTTMVVLTCPCQDMWRMSLRSTSIHPSRSVMPTQVDYLSVWVNIQYAKEILDNEVLDKHITQLIQTANGNFFYYGCVVHSSILQPLNKIGANQAASVAFIKANIEYLMDYAITHLNATICYRAIDMILHVDLDASYLVVPKALSHVACCYYLNSFVKNSHPIVYVNYIDHWTC